MTTLRGTKVRCTLGESVVVGVVTYAGKMGNNVQPDNPDGSWGEVWLSYAWSVEVLPPPAPPLPEVEGTVVLAGSKSLAWQLGYDGLWHTPGSSGTSTDNLIKYHGPLTVLYVPEVTP